MALNPSQLVCDSNNNGTKHGFQLLFVKSLEEELHSTLIAVLRTNVDVSCLVFTLYLYILPKSC